MTVLLQSYICSFVSQAQGDWDRKGPLLFHSLQLSLLTPPQTAPPLKGALQLLGNPSCLLVFMCCSPGSPSHPSLPGSKAPWPPVRIAHIPELCRARSGMREVARLVLCSGLKTTVVKAACLLLSSLYIHQSPPAHIAHIPEPNFIWDGVLLWMLFLLGKTSSLVATSSWKSSSLCPLV